MTLDELYHRVVNTPGDIVEHVPTLSALAKGLDHVTEFGVRWGVSTIALLHGRPKRMVSYDIDRHPTVTEIENAAREAGIDFTFKLESSLTCDIEPTDLLFVDTLHTYAQLLAELNRHGEKVRKHIVLHDTATFGLYGEDGGDGLLRAVDEYFSPRPEWKMAANFLNNNGLRVYTRQK